MRLDHMLDALKDELDRRLCEVEQEYCQRAEQLVRESLARDRAALEQRNAEAAMTGEIAGHIAIIERAKREQAADVKTYNFYTSGKGKDLLEDPNTPPELRKTAESTYNEVRKRLHNYIKARETLKEELPTLEKNVDVTAVLQHIRAEEGSEWGLILPIADAYKTTQGTLMAELYDHVAVAFLKAEEEFKGEVLERTKDGYAVLVLRNPEVGPDIKWPEGLPNFRLLEHLIGLPERLRLSRVRLGVYQYSPEDLLENTLALQGGRQREQQSLSTEKPVLDIGDKPLMRNFAIQHYTVERVLDEYQLPAGVSEKMLDYALRGHKGAMRKQEKATNRQQKMSDVFWTDRAIAKTLGYNSARAICYWRTGEKDPLQRDVQNGGVSLNELIRFLKAHPRIGRGNRKVEALRGA